MTLKRLIEETFAKGNTIVYGEKGSGKDVLFGNVIARNKHYYVANMDYTQDSRYIPLDFMKLNCGYNTWKNFVEGNVNYYEYPYPKGAHIYVSDLGIYLPCQYNNELNKQYPFMPTFFALTRHLTGEASFHGNTQDLKRPWDKYREQARRYILCRGVCKPLMYLGIVVMRVRTYSLYESAVKQIAPCRVTEPLFGNGETRLQAQIYRDNFFNTHGEIKSHLLIFINKSKHDTHYFEKLLKEGKKHEKIKLETKNN